MGWKFWNKKQKKVFIILVCVVITILVLAFPLLKGSGLIPGIAKVIVLLLSAGMIWIVELFEDDYIENVSEGDCVKCNTPCQTIYFEKGDKIEYDCSICGKYQI
jgi:hypothetical protein